LVLKARLCFAHAAKQGQTDLPNATKKRTQKRQSKHGIGGQAMSNPYGDCNYCKNRNLSAYSDTCKYCGLIRKNFEWISFDEYADRAALDDIDDGGEDDEKAR
jgi:hypothetical protein